MTIQLNSLLLACRSGGTQHLYVMVDRGGVVHRMGTEIVASNDKRLFVSEDEGSGIFRTLCSQVDPAWFRMGGSYSNAEGEERADFQITLGFRFSDLREIIIEFNMPRTRIVLPPDIDLFVKLMLQHTQHLVS
jgi:hypothetical protein